MPTQSSAMPGPSDEVTYANAFDRKVAGVFERREADWRNGAVVYQVFVDRFAPSAGLEAKRHLYPAPKRLRTWDEPPAVGEYLPDERVYAHEIDFWGGDLASTRSRLDYIKDLGADVLYLNPIQLSYTNHRYDPLDYTSVAPEFGTRADIVELATDVHDRQMKLVLDGVFNHVGRNSELFCSAESDAASPYRDWFFFGEEYPGGARRWMSAENLPELRLENPAVREYVYSVVRTYLRDGVDGWRLDVAHDIGMRYLEELTNSAHAERSGSLVVGEIGSYAQEWFPAVDGIIQFGIRQIILMAMAGRIQPAHAARMLKRTYADADFEHMLKSWVYLDNHDTARLAHVLPDAGARRFAMVLQFTLPGSPYLYYGTELGMTGGDDPEMRAPMRWDLVTDDNPWLALTRALIALRKDRRALRVGDIRWLVADRLIAFQRFTDRAADAIVVLVNPSPETVREQVLLPDSKMMDGAQMMDLLGGPTVRIERTLLEVEVPPHGCAVLAPVLNPSGGYSPFKRVQ